MQILTDDLITALAQFPDLFIIARHSAFTYKGKAIKEQDIGRELGVQYVLAGSVRRTSEQLRLNVQWVDTKTGEQMWAERYDRPYKDLFAVQDEIVRRIVTTLKLQLSLREKGLFVCKTTNNLEAYDYALRGQDHWLRATKKENQRGREFFEKAVALDPQYAAAYAHLAWTYLLDGMFKWNPDPRTLDRAQEYAQKATALNDFYPLGHTVSAIVYGQQGEAERALTEIERAITLLPNFAESHYARAGVLILAGRPTEGLQAIQHAIRLNPHAPIYFLETLGWALLYTEQYAESIATNKRILALNPFYFPANLMQPQNYMLQWLTQQSHDPNVLAQAYDTAQNAIALSDAYSMSHMVLGGVYLVQKRYDDAIAAYEKAVALDEKSACSHMFLASGLSLAGRIAEALRVAERALSLKALPMDDRCVYAVANAYGLAGRQEESIALSQRMLQKFPNFLPSHLLLANAYAQLGREPEARAAAAEVLRLNPNFSLVVHKERVPLKDPAMLERHIAALRKAGLK